MNTRLEQLHPYPFTRLRDLLAGVEVAVERPISLAVGEPQHSAPAFVLSRLTDSLAHIGRYPTTGGGEPLKCSLVNWLRQRYQLPESMLDTSMVLPALGTREALFAIAQVVIDSSGPERPIVMMPSPFYQIYEGAAIMAGAKPMYLSCHEADGFYPDLDSVSEQQWQACQLFYVCTPGNPTGAVLDNAFYTKLLSYADRYDFVVVSDECYSEIYLDELRPPLGLLDICREQGRADLKRCLVFNSLSKRSNLAGMRSGFVVGDAAIMQQFLLFRTYHGSAMPLHHQAASCAAWDDEQHVIENRALYREKFSAVMPILQTVFPDLRYPDAGFCLWVKTPIDDEQFAQGLYREQGVTVLPGRYLARDTQHNGQQDNAGAGRVRMALVASLDDCVEAAQRIVAYTRQLSQ